MEFASTVREIIAIKKQISRKARNACISSSINEQKMIVCILVVYLLGDESSEREGEFLLRAHLKEKKLVKPDEIPENPKQILSTIGGLSTKIPLFI